jgi:tetratricopeptide (TPR) repeat protein
MQKLTIAFAVAFLVILTAVVGIYILSHKKSAAPPLPSGSTATTTGALQGNGFTIEQVPLGEAESGMPDLTRGVHFSGNIPADVRTIIETRTAEIVARLKKDPTQGGDWFNLAIEYHQANDFDGAREVWEFLVGVLPDDTTSYDNLGKLYHFNLKEYPKAESYFKQSIALKPELITPYLELFDLYRYSYKQNTSAAVDIMTEAKNKFPGNTDPYLLLAGYYRDRGQYASARTEYEAAMDIARTAGDVALMNSIGNELGNLPAQ